MPPMEIVTHFVPLSRRLTCGALPFCVSVRTCETTAPLHAASRKLEPNCALISEPYARVLRWHDSSKYERVPVPEEYESPIAT